MVTYRLINFQLSVVEDVRARGRPWRGTHSVSDLLRTSGVWGGDAREMFVYDVPLETFCVCL